jgi:hypothetical protein
MSWYHSGVGTRFQIGALSALPCLYFVDDKKSDLLVITLATIILFQLYFSLV